MGIFAGYRYYLYRKQFISNFLNERRNGAGWVPASGFMRITAKFRDYENGATKGFVDFVVDGSIGIKDAKLVEGEFGPFIGFAQRKVGEEYRDVITGVSREFSEQLLQAAQAARESEDRKAVIGEKGKPFYNVRATALKDPKGATKALASLTVRENETSEKSMFTINDIRVIEGEKGLFVGLPSVKTKNESFPYSALCYFTGGSDRFLDNLILAKAKDALGIERKPSLSEKMNQATEKAVEDTPFLGDPAKDNPFREAMER